MRILITGAGGFMGSHITDALKSQGHIVYGVDDFSGGYPRNVSDEWDFFSKFDIRSLELCKIIANDFRPEVIYHLAANAREGASFFQPYEVGSRNYGAYIPILESCIATGYLKRVILFSSMAVYGDANQPPFDERMLPTPIDPYGVSKLAMEETTKMLSECHGFDYVIIRPHNVFGSRQNLSDKYRNVIAIFLNNIMRGEPITIYGDGEQERAFSHISDSLPCYVNALYDATGEIVNIGGKESITVNQLADEIISAYLGKDAEWPVEHIPTRHGEAKYAYCTTEKSERLLGYKETVGWKDGIKQMVQYARSCGKQEWKLDHLPLLNDKAPETWKV